MKKKISKVLIVEDEIRMRRVFIMLLSDLLLEFVEAEDGLTSTPDCLTNSLSCWLIITIV